MGSFELDNNIRKRQIVQGIDPNSPDAIWARELEMFGAQADPALNPANQKVSPSC